MYTHALGGGGGGYITESFEDRRICLYLFSFDAIKLEFSLYKWNILDQWVKKLT